MKTRIIAAIAATGLWVSAAFVPNPKLAALPDNTWMMLDTTGIQVEGRMAYSGGAYDRGRHQFVMFGGGHADGYNNAVAVFDLATDTWSEPYPSDPASAYTCANMDSLVPGSMLKSSGKPPAGAMTR